VTTPPGLLDSDGFRVTLQDGSGAILVRLPSDFSAQVGQKLRVIGEVGTYYGAPQLTAEVASHDGQTNVDPTQVRKGPLNGSLEWQLVTVTGMVQDVQRDGDAWRAEVALAEGSIPVAGLPRSGIDSGALVEGREATIVGVVKRAYPTASDQRFALVPRAAADIRLGRAHPTGEPAASDAPADAPDGSADPSETTPAWGVSFGPGATSPVGAPTGRDNAVDPVSLADLVGHVGQRVVVGGFVSEINGARLTIQDESAAAVVRLAGDALSTLDLVTVGDLVNAAGTTDRNAAGGIEITVTDPADIVVLTTTVADQTPTTASEPGQPSSLAETLVEPSGTTPAGPSIMVAAVALILAVALFCATFATSPRSRSRLREWLAKGQSGLKQRLAQLRSS
jgi:hypothetical protein